jgi:hypothetical protein
MSMEPLDQTEVASAPFATVETGAQLLRVLRRRDFTLRGVTIIALISMVANLAMAVALLGVIGRGVIVIGLTPDGGGTIITNGTTLNESRDLKTQAAKLATVTLLDRSPQGSHFIEWKSQLFSRETQALAEQLWLNEQSEFNQRQWQQQTRVLQMDFLDVKGAAVDAVVTGELIRSGPFAGQSTDHRVPYTLHLRLVRNPDLLRSTMYPWFVVAFDLKYEAARP